MATCCSGLALVRCSLVSTASKILKTLVPRPLMVVFPVPSAQMMMFFGTSVGERGQGIQIEQYFTEEEFLEHRGDRQLAASAPTWPRPDGARACPCHVLYCSASARAIDRRSDTSGGEARE